VELTGSHKVLPMNSRAEAVESAIKSVRKWGYEVNGVPDGQAEIFVCADNFHGRTLGITGFSTDAAVREHLGPFAPGFRSSPLATPRHWRRRSSHHLETTGKLLKWLEGVFSLFSKCALKSLNNQADFDSAIRRFDPSRPSHALATS
jgi:4-aminobutyrate aminotransferase-like enzyme